MPAVNVERRHCLFLNRLEALQQPKFLVTMSLILLIGTITRKSIKKAIGPDLRCLRERRQDPTHSTIHRQDQWTSTHWHWQMQGCANHPNPLSYHHGCQYEGAAPTL